jgi:plastocyanin
MFKFYFKGIAIAVCSLAAMILILDPSPVKSQGSSAPPAEVKVDNFSFAPETLTVSVNTTVTWINKDDVPHVIASSDGAFKSKGLDTDDKYSYTFTKPGTYSYYCSIHPKMTGKIVVQ